jgi:hypothetical protein
MFNYGDESSFSPFHFFLPKKMSSISGYTLAGDLPGAKTFSKNGKN